MPAKFHPGSQLSDSVSFKPHHLSSQQVVYREIKISFLLPSLIHWVRPLSQNAESQEKRNTISYKSSVMWPLPVGSEDWEEAVKPGVFMLDLERVEGLEKQDRTKG